MYRSVNTVKTQLNSAYRKLGTSSLEDTLAKARVLGLLSESTDWQFARPLRAPGPLEVTRSSAALAGVDQTVEGGVIPG